MPTYTLIYGYKEGPYKNDDCADLENKFHAMISGRSFGSFLGVTVWSFEECLGVTVWSLERFLGVAVWSLERIFGCHGLVPWEVFGCHGLVL